MNDVKVIMNDFNTLLKYITSAAALKMNNVRIFVLQFYTLPTGKCLIWHPPHSYISPYKLSSVTLIATLYNNYHWCDVNFTSMDPSLVSVFKSLTKPDSGLLHSIYVQDNANNRRKMIWCDDGKIMFVFQCDFLVEITSEYNEDVELLLGVVMVQLMQFV